MPYGLSFLCPISISRPGDGEFQDLNSVEGVYTPFTKITNPVESVIAWKNLAHGEAIFNEAQGVNRPTSESYPENSAGGFPRRSYRSRSLQLPLPGITRRRGPIRLQEVEKPEGFRLRPVFV
jgi:hypothetical protein